MKHPSLAVETLSPVALLQTVKEFARQGGGQRTIVAGGRAFVLALTPARHDDASKIEAGAADVAELEEALLKVGSHGQHEILARPDMLDLKEASALSGIPVRTLTQMRIKNRLLALARAGARKGFRFPAFQFEPAVLAAMPAVLAVFGPGRAWQVFDFLTHPEPLLAGAVPLELLRAGRAADVERVTQAAASLEHGAY
jgi:hypothetical protein